MKPVVKALFLCVFIVNAINIQAQSVVINEVEYSNKTILKDNDGDTPDWFELYNPGKEPINLKGYQITDDTLETDCWRFPDFVIEPDSFVIVFASGKDRYGISELHADFKLGLMEDNLYLKDPAGNIIDKIDKSCAPADNSLSRIPDGSGNIRVTAPTPGKSNNNSSAITINFQPDSLSVNYESGFYTDPIRLEFKNLKSGNKILYTLNGDIPETGSAVHGNSILLDDLTPNKNRFANIPETKYEPGNQIFKANIVRAIVYSDGCPASNEICNTYFINKNGAGRYNVPVVSLITEKDNLFDDETGIYVFGDNENCLQHGMKWERPVHIEIFDTNGNQFLNQNAGARIHGGGSRGCPHKSFRLYARSKYNSEYFEYPFFKDKPNLDKFKTLMLHSSTDWKQSLFLDELGHHLVRNMNIDYSAYQTVIAFINGEYWGIYSLRERQDKYYIENNYGISAANPDIIGYKIKNVGVEEGSIDAYNELVNFVEMTDKQSEEFFDGICQRIDVDGAIDYYIAELYFANTDFPHNNQELWRLNNDTSKWRYFLFDLDALMFRDNYNLLSQYNNQIPENQLFPLYSTIIMRNLLNNEDFRKKFAGNFYHHLNTTFSTDTVLAKIEMFEKLYAPLIQEHAYRWRNPVDYPKWEDNVHALKKFAIERPVEMSRQVFDNFGTPLVIYPNPSPGNINIKLNCSADPVIIDVFDIKGTQVSKWQLPDSENNEITKDTGLDPGLYLLHVQFGNMIYSDKLIIQ